MQGRARATRRARVWVALLAVAIAGTQAPAFAQTSGQNDAGSGTDAGSSPEASLRVPTFGSYTGTLAPGDATDWYRYKMPSATNEAVCVRAPLSTSTTLRATLIAVGDDTTREATSRVVLTRPTHLGVASPSLRGAFLNVSSESLLPTATDYGFQLAYVRASTLTGGDGASGGDAPGSFAEAIPVPSGCFGGALQSAGDVDVYAISAQAGDNVLLSAASAASGFKASILTSTGALVANLRSGDILAFSVPTTGTYYLSATSEGTSAMGALAESTSYMFGVCDPDCGPPASPCRPMCTLLMSDP